MKRYKNLGGNAGIRRYDTGPQSITVEFADGSVYQYTHDIPGEQHVKQMQALAQQGEGLTTYINQHVRDSYARKLK